MARRSRCAAATAAAAAAAVAAAAALALAALAPRHAILFVQALNTQQSTEHTQKRWAPRGGNATGPSSAVYGVLDSAQIAVVGRVRRGHGREQLAVAMVVACRATMLQLHASRHGRSATGGCGESCTHRAVQTLSGTLHA